MAPPFSSMLGWANSSTGRVLSEECCIIHGVRGDVVCEQLRDEAALDAGLYVTSSA
ncbi:hypothetical protein IW137_004813, partial [Coemansia sp. RSA 1287]